MRLTKNYLKKLILEEFDLLLEAEPEEEGTEEEGAEEEGAEEEGAEEEEEQEIYVSPEEEAKLSRSADDQILAHLIDFETKAIKTATVSQDNKLRPEPDVEIELEWYKRPLGSILFEEASEEITTRSETWVGSPDIDIATFSADVSRLIDNYDSLLDMEALIINKAMDYLLDKYDQETADYYIEVLDVKYGKYSDHPTVHGNAEENESPPAPQAIGSMAGEGGA